jgi:transcriptional regulator with XRE-family HTH domain
MRFTSVPLVGTIGPVTAGTLGDRVKLRLEQLRESDRLSANRVNELAGFRSDGYVSRISTGARKKVDPEALERLAAALRVRFDWLVRGVGEMELDPDPPQSEHLPEKAKVALRVAIGRGVDMATALERLEEMRRSTSEPDELITLSWVIAVLDLPSDARPADDEESPMPPSNPDIDPMVLLKVYDDLCDPRKFPQAYSRELVSYALSRQRWRHKRSLAYEEVLWGTKEEIDEMIANGEWPLKG